MGVVVVVVVVVLLVAVIVMVVVLFVLTVVVMRLISYLGCLTCSQEMQASVNVLTLRRFAVCVSVMFTFIAGVLCDQHVGPSNGTAASQKHAQLIQTLPSDGIAG